jgi:hypothetical protein
MNSRTKKTLRPSSPIIPVLGSPALHDPKWIYEPKFDGFRGVVYLFAACLAAT